jgi:hypothetical protein
MQAFVLATLLEKTENRIYKTDDNKNQPIWKIMLRRHAIRTSVNRIVAGVHFPIDSAAGALLGIALGRHFVERMLERDVEKGAWSFGGKDDSGTPVFPNNVDWSLDVDWTSLLDCAWEGNSSSRPDYVGERKDWDLPVKKRRKVPIKLSPPRALGWLWTQAANEWPDPVLKSVAGPAS